MVGVSYVIIVCMKYDKDLKSLANIKSGFAFRTAIKGCDGPGWAVVQPKNIVGEDFFDLTRIKSGSIPESHLLKVGDVLVTNRGAVRACVFQGGKTVTTNAVFVVSVYDQQALLPEYLALYINSEYGQRQIKTKQSCMTVTAMTMSEFADLIIPVPAINKQRALVGLNEVVSRSAKVMRQLNELQNNILNESIKGVLNG